jgi:hypothetical protein
MQITFFQKKKSFKKEEKNTDPDFFWRILLLATFFIILASFFFGFLLFKQVDRELVLPAGGPDAKLQKITKGRIDKVLGYFSERAKKSEKILNSPSPIVDPSL